MNFNRVASDSELATAKTHVIAVVLQINETPQNAAHVVINVGMKLKKLAPIFIGVAHSVDARHRSDNDCVSPSEQRRRRRMSQSIDVIIN